MSAWWQTDTYDSAEPLPESFTVLAGPHGPALVKVWGDGTTDKGWGLVGPNDEHGNPTPGFIERYGNGDFLPRKALYGYSRGRWAFAIVMRSVNMVCIDIDGKNGGLEHAKRLGRLAPTLAETSKSGDGYHLFYALDEEWDENKGFGQLGDRIGIEVGVDIRATGCVYHYPQQRWNGRLVAPLPKHLKEILLSHENRVTAQSERIIKVLESTDDMEILMLQDEIVTELNKPIAPGKRNITLFAIGNKMRQAQIPDWETLLEDRAHKVGLDDSETRKLVANIKRYGS